jgi:hypothetical protein
MGKSYGKGTLLTSPPVRGQGTVRVPCTSAAAEQREPGLASIDIAYLTEQLP